VFGLIVVLLLRVRVLCLRVLAFFMAFLRWFF